MASSNIVLCSYPYHKQLPYYLQSTTVLCGHSRACQLTTPTRYCNRLGVNKAGTAKASRRLTMNMYWAGYTWGLEAAALLCSAGELSLRPSPFTACFELCLSAFLSFPRNFFSLTRRALTDMVPSLASKRKYTSHRLSLLASYNSHTRTHLWYL